MARWSCVSMGTLLYEVVESLPHLDSKLAAEHLAILAKEVVQLPYSF